MIMPDDEYRMDDFAYSPNDIDFVNELGFAIFEITRKSGRSMIDALGAIEILKTQLIKSITE